jgi:hypothetical protein
MSPAAPAAGGSAMARRMWQALETLHMTVYFAPEPRDAYRRAGLRGGWMGYFASRSAAMGPVPAEVVVATFYNFHPRMVHRAIPDAWGFAPPEAVLAARLEGADAALRRLLGGWAEGPEAAEAAALGRRAMEGRDPAGRPLFAAHAALGWPEEPHLALWHAATLYREFRGDGHVACLLADGVDGCEAHVLAAGAGQLPGAFLREYRGWSEEEWAAAAARLRARGLVTGDGRLTEAGRATRGAIEDRTDDLAVDPWRHLGEQGCARLLDLLGRPTRLIVQGRGVPFPNPVGLPEPAA